MCQSLLYLLEMLNTCSVVGPLHQLLFSLALDLFFLPLDYPSEYLFERGLILLSLDPSEQYHDQVFQLCSEQSPLLLNRLRPALPDYSLAHDVVDDEGVLVEGSLFPKHVHRV